MEKDGEHQIAMAINYSDYESEEDELDDLIVILQKQKRITNQKRSNS